MAQRFMQAIRVHEFGGPEVLSLDEVEIPAPGKGCVLVEVHAAGVNPVDTYIHTGTYARTPTLPYTPGADGAGVVAALGDGVAGLAVGDRVYLAGSISGTYADYAVCRADQVFTLPNNISYSQGAALGVPHTTAWRALFQRGRAQAGETVLIHGATGAVGLAAVQMALAAGLRVLATGGSEAGRVLLAEQGEVAVYDHHADTYVDAIKAAGGVDLILEMLANVNLDHDLDMLAPKGRVAVIGNRGRVDINPRSLMQSEGEILGVLLFAATAAESAAAHAGIVAGLTHGSLAPVVGQVFTLDQASVAHHQVMEAGHRGKTVLLTASGKSVA